MSKYVEAKNADELRIGLEVTAKADAILAAGYPNPKYVEAARRVWTEGANAKEARMSEADRAELQAFIDGDEPLEETPAFWFFTLAQGLTWEESILSNKLRSEDEHAYFDGEGWN